MGRSQHSLVRFDIGHPQYTALLAPDTAFWTLVDRHVTPRTLDAVEHRYAAQADAFTAEMDALRFGVRPAAVYFNPTDRCNLDCTYCYIPAQIRRGGEHMRPERVDEALSILSGFFSRTLPSGTLPQVIFHGSEPLMNATAVFDAIDRHRDAFHFGVQTNGTLLNDRDIEFLTGRGVSIGLSLDGPDALVANRTRHTARGRGVFTDVMATLQALRGYETLSVICTVTAENLETLPALVELLHGLEVPTCMLNPVRCTMPGGLAVRPDEAEHVHHYLEALDRSHALYRQTGRKLVVANFANILLAIVAPTARRLMCDISPCGGGRCFFAVSAHGDVFPCSEFLGLDAFNGGNLFTDDLDVILASPPFRQVMTRATEGIDACRSCPIQHFCGAPCPAEAHELHGDVNRPGAFCDLYAEQTRYAFRSIADGTFEDYLWDDWASGTTTAFDLAAP